MDPTLRLRILPLVLGVYAFQSSTRSERRRFDGAWVSNAMRCRSYGVNDQVAYRKRADRRHLRKKLGKIMRKKQLRAKR